MAQASAAAQGRTEEEEGWSSDEDGGENDAFHTPPASPSHTPTSLGDAEEVRSLLDTSIQELADRHIPDRRALLASTGCPEAWLPALEAMLQRFPGSPPFTCARFLEARGYRLDKAATMYEAHLAWRAEVLPITATANQRTMLEEANRAHSSPTPRPTLAGQRAPKFYRVQSSEYQIGSHAGEAARGGVVICCALGEWVGLGAAELEEALAA